MSNILGCKRNYKKPQRKENENDDEFILRIRNEFVFNVFHNKYTFKGKVIKFQKYINSQKEIESFYHVTTKDKYGKRIFSMQRCESCLLIFILLDDCVCNKVVCQCVTIKTDFNNSNRIRIYCAEYRYVIILESKESYYKFVTAFPVSKSNVKKYL